MDPDRWPPSGLIWVHLWLFRAAEAQSATTKDPSNRAMDEAFAPSESSGAPSHESDGAPDESVALAESSDRAPANALVAPHADDGTPVGHHESQTQGLRPRTPVGVADPSARPTPRPNNRPRPIQLLGRCPALERASPRPRANHNNAPSSPRKCGAAAVRPCVPPTLANLVSQMASCPDEPLDSHPASSRGKGSKALLLQTRPWWCSRQARFP